MAQFATLLCDAPGCTARAAGRLLLTLVEHDAKRDLGIRGEDFCETHGHEAMMKIIDKAERSAR